MGGKPSKNTPKDMRLARNNPQPGKRRPIQPPSRLATVMKKGSS